MATDPPSYESVIASIAAQIPSNASPAKILDTVKSITPEQATVIAANTEKTQWNPSDHQKAQFILGVAKAITSSDLEEQLRKSSQDAVDAIVSINGMFTDLTARLAHIDQLVDNDQDPFTPKLQTLRKVHQEFQANSGVLMFRSVFVMMCRQVKILRTRLRCSDNVGSIPSALANGQADRNLRVRYIDLPGVRRHQHSHQRSHQDSRAVYRRE